MTYVVTGRCTNCKYTDCAVTCPVSAFHEGPNMLYINPNTCIDCNACVDACPVQAIFRDADVPARYADYLNINAEQAPKFPEIIDKKAPLPTAKTLDQVLAAEEQNL